MELNIGDKIIYEDSHSNFFKGEIVDIWKDDYEEISAYFVATDTGLHIHFKPSSLEYCRLDESLAGEYASSFGS
ncbi:MAG: hypothetical protein JW762_07490 [Dehalococcoidales bacterium]|nr:hypothetical protein [Dehalococcoidales bacterium]